MTTVKALCKAKAKVGLWLEEILFEHVYENYYGAGSTVFSLAAWLKPLVSDLCYAALRLGVLAFRK